MLKWRESKIEKGTEFYNLSEAFEAFMANRMNKQQRHKSWHNNEENTQKDASVSPAWWKIAKTDKFLYISV